MTNHPKKSVVRITLRNLQNKLPIHSRRIKNLILKVLKGERVKESVWVNICFVDNRQVKKFNAKFLNSQSATDVLAFNLSDKKEKNIILADIMISAQEALKQAGNFETTPDYELSLYVVHGLLHILGFNDHTACQKKRMREKESQYVD
jgi:probable rRNA maturation factor